MQNNDVRNRAMNSAAITPMKTYERERINRNIKYPSFVNGYAARQAAYGFLFGSTGIAGILTGIDLLWYPIPLVTGIMMASLIGGCISGMVGGYFLRESKGHFVNHMTEYEIAGFETPQEVSDPRELVLLNGQPTVKRRENIPLEHGGHKFVFTGLNLDMLYNWYVDGHEAIRKQFSPVGPGFDRLPNPITGAKYTTALHVLQKLELVDKGNKWTPKGVAFIKGE